MKIIFLITLVWGWDPGCNDVAQKNGPSSCYEHWQKKDKVDAQDRQAADLDAVRCCINNRVSIREENYNEFNVPFIVLEQPLSKQPLNFRECRNSSRYSCIPEAKCFPQRKHDIHGFFNFLDLYRKIPFEDYPDQTKSLNWECYNTNDNFVPETEIDSRIGRRIENNFCRYIVYDYFIANKSRSFTEDICQDSYEYDDQILPFQRRGKLERRDKLEFSQLNQYQNFALRSPIIMLRNVRKNYRGDPTTRVKTIAQYNSVKKRPITIFEDFYERWKNMGVQFPEDFQRNKSAPIHRTTNCGCFTY